MLACMKCRSCDARIWHLGTSRALRTQILTIMLMLRHGSKRTSTTRSESGGKERPGTRQFGRGRLASFQDACMLQTRGDQIHAGSSCSWSASKRPRIERRVPRWTTELGVQYDVEQRGKPRSYYPRHYFNSACFCAKVTAVTSLDILALLFGHDLHCILLQLLRL